MICAGGSSRLTRLPLLTTPRSSAAGRGSAAISMADAQIASICRKLQATLATRNTRDFEDTGIDVIDPWSTR